MKYEAQKAQSLLFSHATFDRKLVLSTNRNTLSQTPVGLNNNGGGSVVDRSYALPVLHSHKALSDASSAVRLP